MNRHEPGAHGGPATFEPPTLVTLRRALLAILIAGVAGMGAELLLIGHVEGALQLTPVTLLGLGLVTLAWFAIAPNRASARAAQVVMALFVASGAAGVVLHYRGNAAFELEMYPKMSGTELVRETLTGATPVLAPGSMALLGLVGLASTFRHPALRRGTVDSAL
jgi:hypothetical protein